MNVPKDLADIGGDIGDMTVGDMGVIGGQVGEAIVEKEFVSHTCGLS